MSAAYDAAEWTDLFVASAGATAALAGLLFVAVSINVERILAFRGLPERALEALLVLVGALVASVFALAPVDDTALGWLLLATGAVVSGAVVRLERVSLTERQDRSVPATVAQVALSVVGTLPFVAGGISLIAGGGGGLYWVLAGVVGAVVAAAANAWVLMIEILR